MRSLAQLRLDAERKNELRRSSGLPLLDVELEIGHMAYEDYCVLYRAKSGEEGAVLARMKAEVLSELRAKNGPEAGLSTGGRWLIWYSVRDRFCDHMRSVGFPLPSTEAGLAFARNVAD